MIKMIKIFLNWIVEILNNLTKEKVENIGEIIFFKYW